MSDCHECGEEFDSPACCVNDPPEVIAAARAANKAWAQERGLIGPPGPRVIVSGSWSSSEDGEL